MCRFSPRLLALACGWAVAATAMGRAPAADERPNLVFLLTDDQRADTLGCMGNAIIRTPHLDALARRGVTFDNAFVATSICMTSRASVLTGQYAARHGVWNFRTEFTPEQLAATYPGRLKAAGYHVGFIGKWGVGQPPRALFDYDRTFPGQGQYLTEHDGKPIHLTRLMGDQTLEFIAGAPDDRPFSLSISFKAPHVQDTPSVNAQSFIYDPAHASWYADATIPLPKLAASRYFDRLPDFLKNTENRARWAVRFWGPARYQDSVKSYYRLITEVDDEVGRIVAKLEKRGLADNTVILFTSDHGFYLGEYGFAGKWFAHDVSIRVPMILADPRLPKSCQGTRCDEMVLNLDVAPTLVELAGIETDPRMQGTSLVPQAAGQSPEWREEFFYEHHFEHPRIPPSEAVRTRQWKYIRFVGEDPPYEEMYDLSADPLEEHNLAGSPDHAEALADMRARWKRLREAAK